MKNSEYVSQAMFLAGNSFLIPAGTIVLRVSLKEAKFIEANWIMCLVLAIFGLFLMYCGYIIKEEVSR